MTMHSRSPGSGFRDTALCYKYRKPANLIKAFDCLFLILNTDWSEEGLRDFILAVFAKIIKLESHLHNNQKSLFSVS